MWSKRPFRYTIYQEKLKKLKWKINSNAKRTHNKFLITYVYTFHGILITAFDWISCSEMWLNLSLEMVSVNQRWIWFDSKEGRKPIVYTNRNVLFELMYGQGRKVCQWEKNISRNFVAQTNHRAHFIYYLICLLRSKCAKTNWKYFDLCSFFLRFFVCFVN